MTDPIKRLNFSAGTLDFCVYLGLMFWIASVTALENETRHWTHFGLSLSAIILSQLPVLAFAWKKDAIRTSMGKRGYKKIWLACFAIYLPLVIAGSSLMLNGKRQIWEVVAAAAAGTLFLELILVSNAYYASRVKQVKWVRDLNLEKAVLISITLIAMTLSAMAVSSLNNPLYHSREQLLIGFEFSLVKVLARFGTFLSFTVQFLVMYLCGYFFFLINSRILVAKVLKERGVLIYVLSSLAIVGIAYPVMGQLLTVLPISRQLGGVFSDNPFVWENAFGAIIILLISLPVLLAVQWAKQNTLIVSLEKEKAQAELDLLKQQLNPHFFFNTLNNLYALSLQHSKDTPQVILQLSDLMRYVIYKSANPLVSINDEVNYLRDYLELQSMRMKDKLELIFEEKIENEHYQVAPLLLIVLIENALKHGIEPAERNAFLSVSIIVEGEKLSFECVNSFEPKPDMNGGIGLSNLRKRLQLLYPERHRLAITVENPIFKVELDLENP